MKRSFALLALVCACGAANATSYDWWEYNQTEDSPLGSGTYTAGASSSTLEFNDVWIKNTGSETKHLGTFFGWMWVTNDPTGANSSYIPLTWNNATQTFHTDNFGAAGHTLDVKVEFTGISSGFLPLTSVGNTTGTAEGHGPWSFDPGVAPIAPDSSWNVPFIDLGDVAPGQQSASFGLKFTQIFGDPTDVDNFWGYQYWGQNVTPAPVPEPATLAVLGIGALALRRRKRTR